MEGGIDLQPHLDRLDDSLDDLEEILEPLLNDTFPNTIKKLPLLDQAKLHVLITYTIESVLFSYLTIHGVRAKDHAIFRELTRTKQYFEKLKVAEHGPTKRENMSLDKAAAARIIKHGLSGNEQYDIKRAEAEAKQRAIANIKLAKMKKTQTPSTPASAAPSDTDGTRKIEESSDDSSSESDSGDTTGKEDTEMVDPEATIEQQETTQDSQPPPSKKTNIQPPARERVKSKAEKRKEKKQRRKEKLQENYGHTESGKVIGGKVSKKKKNKNKGKKSSAEAEMAQ